MLNVLYTIQLRILYIGEYFLRGVGTIESSRQEPRVRVVEVAPSVRNPTRIDWLDYLAAYLNEFVKPAATASSF
jgi:hypothetical protein